MSIMLVFGHLSPCLKGQEKRNIRQKVRYERIKKSNPEITMDKIRRLGRGNVC